jgi:peptidoglycan/LPS O-acetylase OafA/YrhL
MQSAPRRHGIDTLRGLCILAVLLLHIDIRIPFAASALGAHLPRAAWSVLFRSGFYGVRIFFVISGFLITANILRRWGQLPRIRLTGFYQLRFARIAPCLLALLAILSLLHALHLPGFTINPAKTTLLRALSAALLFHINQLEIAIGYLPANWDVLWSLSVEEAFYVLYPLLCRFAPRAWLLALIAVALICAGPFARTVWGSGNELAEDYSYFAGFDCIAFGCFAAVAAHYRRFTPLQQRLMRYSGIVLMLLILVYRQTARQLHLGSSGLDVTVLAFGTALLLTGAEHEKRAARWAAPLEWFGRNSYEIYLTHSFVTVLGAQAFHTSGAGPNSAPLWHAGLIAISAILGWLVARYYSEPLNRALRRSRQLPVQVHQ